MQTLCFYKVALDLVVRFMEWLGEAYGFGAQVAGSFSCIWVCFMYTQMHLYVHEIYVYLCLHTLHWVKLQPGVNHFHFCAGQWLEVNLWVCSLLCSAGLLGVETQIQADREPIPDEAL